MHSPFWLPHSAKRRITLEGTAVALSDGLQTGDILPVGLNVLLLLLRRRQRWWWWLLLLLRLWSRRLLLGYPCLSQSSPVHLTWILLVLERLHPLLLAQRPLRPGLSSLVPHHSARDSHLFFQTV